MRGTQGVLHNLSILTVGQIVSQLANMAALVYLADFLGPHDFGVVQIGVAFMSYVLITAEWGMMALGIREISRLEVPGDIFRYASQHCGIMTVQALVVLVAGVLVLPLLPFYKHDHLVFLLYLAHVLPQIYTQTWVAVGLERMKWVGISRIVRSLTYALLVFLAFPLLTRMGVVSPAPWVPIFYLVAVLVSNAAINFPLAHWFGRFIHPRIPPWPEFRRRLGQTSSIGANTVVLRILFNIDLILLGSLASPEVAGNYAAAAKIVFFLVVAVEVLWSALLPRLSRMAKQSRPMFRTTFNFYFGIIAALLGAIALGGWMLGPAFVDFIYRGKFTTAGPVFQILSLSYAMLALATYLGNSLLAEDRQRSYLLPLIISSVGAVVAIRILVPTHGGLGASWGILAAHGLLLGILAVINARNFNRLLLETLLGTLPALGAMAALIAGTGAWHVLGRILLGAVGYLLVAAYPLWRLRRSSAAVLAEHEGVREVAGNAPHD